ncbi:hypothetical protein, partial [Bacteroides xylanisolvens]|uniref:hypothetical protein n=1 Tax=Bacteroides xylanisolvens TaxID=371601 RepID=UPI00319DA2CB
IFNYPRFGRQTVFWGECLKIQKRQLTRNELVALNFIILGISLITQKRAVVVKLPPFYLLLYIKKLSL